MLKSLQFVFDAVIDASTGCAVHHVRSSGLGVSGEDKCEDCQESDNFHDILNIRINLNPAAFA